MTGHAIISDLFDTKKFVGIVVTGLALLIGVWLVSVLTTKILESPEGISAKVRNRLDRTFYRYFIRIKNVLLFVVAAYVYSDVVPGLKNLLAPMLASAGAIALIIGFAANATISNFVSGLLLTFYRPIRIGDKVEIEGQYCTIEEMTFRHTIARSIDNTRILIPNAKLDEMTLVNYSIIDQRLLCAVVIGVSFDTDIDLARKMIIEEAEACPNRDKDADPPWVRVVSYGDFSIGLRVYMWVPTPEDWRFGRYWLLEMIKKRFDAEGVEIPFPYRTLVYKNDLPQPARG